MCHLTFPRMAFVWCRDQSVAEYPPQQINLPLEPNGSNALSFKHSLALEVRNWLTPQHFHLYTTSMVSGPISFQIYLTSRPPPNSRGDIFIIFWGPGEAGGSQAIGCRLQAAGSRQQVAGRRSLAAGRLQQVACSRSLAA